MDGVCQEHGKLMVTLAEINVKLDNMNEKLEDKDLF